MELLSGGASYQDIAEQLGYTNRAAAWRLVQKGLQRQVDENAEFYMQSASDRLDAVLHAFWPAATEDKDAAAAHVVLRVIDGQCRLSGIDGGVKGRWPAVLDPKPEGVVLTAEELVCYYRQQLAYAENDLARRREQRAF